VENEMHAKLSLKNLMGRVTWATKA